MSLLFKDINMPKRNEIYLISVAPDKKVIYSKISAERPDPEVLDAEDVIEVFSDINDGHWIEVEINGDIYNRCSVCRNILEHPRTKYDFCPNCGSKMRG